MCHPPLVLYIHIWLVEARGVVKAGCVPHGQGRRVDKVGRGSWAAAFLTARSALQAVSWSTRVSAPDSALRQICISLPASSLPDL